MSIFHPPRRRHAPPKGSQRPEGIESVNPVFVDGPLKGQDYWIPRDQLGDILRVGDVVYRIRRVALFSHAIMIGSTQLEARDENYIAELFTQIVSDRGKEAVDNRRPVWNPPGR